MSKFEDWSDVEIAAAMAEVAAQLANLCYFMITNSVRVPEEDLASENRDRIVDRMNELSAEIASRFDETN